MTAYWPTLGSYVEGLEKAGKLIRITTPVNKDTELHPLVRLQFRGLPESQRKAFLFENVVDSAGRRYDIPVLVGALAGSADIYALGMGCGLDEIEDVWRKALAHQIAPVVVGAPPCQEVVIRGEELRRPGGGRQSGLPGGGDHRRGAEPSRSRARPAADPDLDAGIRQRALHHGRPLGH